MVLQISATTFWTDFLWPRNKLPDITHLLLLTHLNKLEEAGLQRVFYSIGRNTKTLLSGEDLNVFETKAVLSPYQKRSSATCTVSVSIISMGRLQHTKHVLDNSSRKRYRIMPYGSIIESVLIDRAGHAHLGSLISRLTGTTGLFVSCCYTYMLSGRP